MKVVVDENIPYAAQAFADAGPVVALPGRSITRDRLTDAHTLIVRSVTKVDARLLEGTPVRFVGTCTIGTDHLDIPWLESRGIRWANAPGCNARSVAEWVFSALAFGHLRRRLDLESLRRVGVIGVGRVGGLVASLLEKAGWETLRNDPPREALEGPRGFHPLEEVLSQPLVLAHLPLVTEGSWPTRGLLAHNLQRLPFGGGFLNAGRGATVSTPDLANLAARRPDLFLALDVFDPEPDFPAELALKADLISPHVAGYSLEGKIEGTRMVREALGQFLDLSAWRAPDPDPDPVDASLLRLFDSRPVTPDCPTWDALSCLILAAHDPRRDDSLLREAASLPDSARGGRFDRMRKEYPTRLEWKNRPVLHPRTLPGKAWDLARELGFCAA